MEYLFNSNSPHRFYGPVMEIKDPDQFVPLFVTRESPNAAMVLQALATLVNGVKIPSLLWSGFKTPGGISGPSGVDKLRTYLRELFKPEYTNYRFSLSKANVALDNSYTLVKPIGGGNTQIQECFFAGQPRELTNIMIGYDAYHRLGLQLALIPSDSFISSLGKSPYFPNGLQQMSSGSYITRRISYVNCMIVVQARYLRYLRARNSMGLPFTLPRGAIRILQSVVNPSGVGFDIGTYMQDYSRALDIPIEAVAPSQLMKYLIPMNANDRPEHYKAANKEELILNVRKTIATLQAI